MIGDTLKKLRSDAGLTSEELCAKIGIKGGSYRNYERNDRKPDYETLIKLANFYGVSTDYILGRTNTLKNPLDEFAQREHLKTLEKLFMQKYLNLTSDQRDKVLDFLREIVADEASAAAAAAEARNNMEIVRTAARKPTTYNAPHTEAYPKELLDEMDKSAPRTDSDIMLKDTLKLLREQKNLTKKQVADAIEVTERAYITYEYGQRDVSTETLQKLADFYGVTTDYLLGRQEATDSKKPLDEFAQRKCLKNPEKIFLQKYLELTDDQRDNVLDFFRRVAEGLHKET